MWFKLNTTFTQSLGTLSELSNSWSITRNLTNYSTTSTTTSVAKNGTYSATFTLNAGCTYSSHSVTMGGATVSSASTASATAYKYDSSTHTITFSNFKVTGALVITAVATGASSGGSGGDKPVTPASYTFTISPTPTSATVTLTASGYTQNGNSITVANGTTVSWRVSASEYTEQTGTWTASGSDETLSVTLNAIAPAGNVMDYVVDEKFINGTSVGKNVEFFLIENYPVIAGHKYLIPYARNGYFKNESGTVSNSTFAGGGKSNYSVVVPDTATLLMVCVKYVDTTPENASITDLGAA